jgi:hypothetical protein
MNTRLAGINYFTYGLKTYTLTENEKEKEENIIIKMLNVH